MSGENTGKEGSYDSNAHSKDRQQQLKTRQVERTAECAATHSQFFKNVCVWVNGHVKPTATELVGGAWQVCVRVCGA